MVRVKDIKQMQLDYLEQSFRDVRDMVILSPTKVDAVSENRIRLELRKKDIYLRLVKNTFMKRVFDRLGIKVEGVWEGPTMLAWGSTGVSTLGKEVQKAFKEFKGVTFKGAIADGQQISFDEALKMPTREEAIGRVIGLFLSQGARIAGQLRGPASRLVGQIRSKAEQESGG